MALYGASEGRAGQVATIDLSRLSYRGASSTAHRCATKYRWPEGPMDQFVNRV